MWVCSLFSLSCISTFVLASSGGYSSAVAPLRWIPLWLKKRQIPFFLLQDMSSGIQQLYRTARSWLALHTPIGLLFSRRGRGGKSVSNSMWCVGTSSYMLVSVCCVQQTRARGSGLLLLWQGAGRLHGAMPRTWGLCSVQRLELHVMMKPEAVFKNPEMQNIIRSQQ